MIETENKNKKKNQDFYLIIKVGKWHTGLLRTYLLFDLDTVKGSYVWN